MRDVPKAVSASPSDAQRATGRFAKHQRLQNTAQYKAVFDHGIRRGDRDFTLFCKPNRLGHARLGLAVPKRAVNKATARNRLKRLIRESFRRHQHELGACDVVVLVRSQAQQQSNQAIFERLRNHWRAITKACEHSSSGS